MMISTKEYRVSAFKPTMVALALATMVTAALAPQTAAAFTAEKTGADLATGIGDYRIRDYVDGVGALRFERVHKTKVPTGGAFFGSNWRTNFDSSLIALTGGMVEARRPDGASYRFNAGIVLDPTATAYAATAGVYSATGVKVSDKLVVETSNGLVTRVIYRAVSEGLEEVYDQSLRLVRIVHSNGYAQDLVRNAEGKISAVNDSNGRSLSFAYDPTSGLLTSFTDPAGVTHNYTYTTARLLEVYTDPAGGGRRYIYSGKRLTHVADEQNQLLHGFGYDSSGRINALRELAKQTVVAYSFYYENGNRDIRVEETGLTQSSKYFRKINGKLRAEYVAQANRQFNGQRHYGYDANGNTSRYDDPDGYRTCSSYDLTRNLPLVKVDGLPSTRDAVSNNLVDDCATHTASNAMLTGDARKQTYQYHPDWPVSTRKAEPRRITTIVYNGQPDPTNGNAILTCATGLPTMPSGAKLALPCKVVDSATTDLDGSAGFTATLDTTVPVRVRMMQYNADGQLVSATDAAGKTTTYSYYTGVESGKKMGDLQTITDPKGFVDEFLAYNPHGQLLSKTAADGLQTAFTYDNMGRVLTSTVDGLTTTFTRDSRGVVTKVVRPEGAEVSYTYDQYRRVVTETDMAGNVKTISYHPNDVPALERWATPSGQVIRETIRSLDDRGKLKSIKG